jgi:hypothetical protein
MSPNLRKREKSENFNRKKAADGIFILNFLSHSLLQILASKSFQDKFLLTNHQIDPIRCWSKFELLFIWRKEQNITPITHYTHYGLALYFQMMHFLYDF